MQRPPDPEPLPLPVVDDHTHLDFEPVEEVAELLARAVSAGVPRSVQIGCDVDAARWTVAAVELHPELVGGVALHPTEASRLGRPGVDAALDEIETLARHPRVRVVGETGLDHYWVQDPAERAVQEYSFRRHIDLAKRLGAALQIHDREAHADVLRVLDEEGAPERTVLHCFSGDAEMARHCAARGWILSFAGTLTFKNAQTLRDALRAVPLEQVQVETDAPYLTPVPYRGRPNAGYLVPITVRCMAEVTGRDLDQVCGTLAATADTLYGPW